MLNKFLSVLLFFCITFWVTESMAVPTQINNEKADTIEQKAKTYLQKGQYPQAEQIYQTIVKEYPRTDYEFRANKELAILYIKSGKIKTAYETAEILINKFPQHSDLPAALYEITEEYERADKFEEAKLEHQQIAQNYLGNPYAQRSAVGIPKVEIMSLIMSQKFTQAEKALAQLALDFTDNLNLPEALYWIAERYTRPNINRFEDAKHLCRQIIENYSDTPWADKSRLFIAKIDVMSLVSSQQFNQAQKALDKLSVEFAGNPDLPETLYWIAETYKRSDKFAEAKRIYQKIVRYYPDSLWADKSKFCIARADIMLFFMSGKYDQAKKAFDKLAVDFAGHPDLPEALYWITERFERAGRFEDAKELYQKIIDNYPDTQWADKSRFCISRTDVKSIAANKNYGQLQEAIYKLAGDFSSSPDLAESVYWIAVDLSEKQRYEEAIQVADIGIANFCTDFPTDRNYYLKGFCYSKLDNYEEALNWYNRVLNEFPSSTMANDARMQKGRMLYFKGEYQESVDAFKNVLYNNPNEALAKEAQQNINDIEKVFLKKR
jgi:TolA-binding protein